jgi:hypothetical protein
MGRAAAADRAGAIVGRRRRRGRAEARVGSSLGQSSGPKVPVRPGNQQGPRLRFRFSIFSAAAVLAGCAPGGYPALRDSYPPPFDAFGASQRLQVGMPREIAIIAIGWSPISSQTTTCGVLTAVDSPCEVLTFGVFDNNRLTVYLVPTGQGFSVVTSWLAHKG